MTRGKGWSHISLATLDMNATRAFYEGILGFKAVRCDQIKVKEGGEIRHVFFDTGAGQLLAFMEPRITGGPTEFDGSLNRPLGMPDGVYHFAFEAGDEAELNARRADLIAKGVKVTPVVDHEWAKSIYFKDPNGLMIEFSYITRDFTEDDGRMQPRFEMSLFDHSPITDFRDH
ncbi:MAG: VOC family protein [Deltaproteobacteria bacterium]|nr:VOC family protein [Deltaproteobacteria bacterium]